MVRFCGSQDFAWSYHGRTVPYTENYDIVQPHRKQKTTDAAFKKGNNSNWLRVKEELMIFRKPVRLVAILSIDCTHTSSSIVPCTAFVCRSGLLPYLECCMKY